MSEVPRGKLANVLSNIHLSANFTNPVVAFMFWTPLGFAFIVDCFFGDLDNSFRRISTLKSTIQRDLCYWFVYSIGIGAFLMTVTPPGLIQKILSTQVKRYFGWADTLV